MELPDFIAGYAVAQLVKALGYKPVGRGFDCCRYQWPNGLRRGSAAARLLGLRVRIPPGAWILCSVS